ncbi:MAG: hypothetical protein QQW96_00710 [Tychonema bourrellyi B0820]|uniref:Glycosyltransferase RgtA/B/C/D-like domain-containing protein n=1 Tax=Tychonema bourrellyi FEM_GT703 TaxID=2040638 RepID=A0A2G4F150_9CYAN|nr:hypothetical protein [Tychonema bourrellyi]MDQ2096158.1 hypothetical protein [Tychonema bourrellyi B0820]PHX55482.1 hypothetical protein CP500_010695 [Tychonema bourrellyi FEM_GT703]
MNLTENKLYSKIAINGTLLLLVFFITIAVSSIYVSSEHTFYWWDYAGYNNATVGLANSFRESPEKAVRAVIESLANEKNLLISLPLVPFILLFGDSRLSYILSVSLIYVVPFRLLLGAISVKLIPVYPRRVFWSTVLLSFLIPMSWIPTLRGYLDTGGCVFVALAILVYLHDVKLKYWWQILLIGFSLAMAILFRRHFAYSAIAFFGAAILQYLIEFILTYKNLKNQAWKNLFTSGMKLGLIMATSFAILMLVAGDFTRSALTVDYRNLYMAWSLPVNDILTRYANFYGLGTWLLVMIGFSAGLVTRILLPSTTIFIAIFGILSLIEWLLVLRYGYLHYTIHITPIALLGLSAFFWTTWLTRPGKVRYLMLGVAGLYLSVNAVLGLIPLKLDISRLFMGNFPPLVRSDYGEVVKLVEFLRKIAPNQEPIYIAGASNSFNANILKQANRKLNPPEGWWKLNTLGRPLIDSRDTYPLPELLISQYVVVATPFQQVLLSDEQVLRSHEQDVVKVVYDAFTQNWEISRDFQLLPEQFQLENGVIVRVYRRMRPSAIGTAIKTLNVMQQQIAEKPGTQLDWISLNQSVYTSSNYPVKKESDYLYNIVTHPIKNTKQLDTSFLYLGSLSEKKQISGKLNLPNKQCEGVSLRLTLWNNQGKLINSTETAYNLTASPKLNLLLEGKSPNYLLLEVLSTNKQDLTNQCQLEINNLAISAPKS